MDSSEVESAKLNPDAQDYAGPVESASCDRAARSAGERAALKLKRIAGQGIAPVIQMKRRCFYATGTHTVVVERPRGGGYSVARVPSS